MLFWPGGSARRPGRAARDDRPPPPVHQPSVPAAGGQPGLGLPPPSSGQRRGSSDDGTDRPPVSGVPLLRVAPHDGMAGHARAHSEPQAGAAPVRLMGLVAIYQRPNTSKAAPEHTKY